MQTPLPLKKILLVDDVDACRLTTKWFLESLGHTVVSVRSAEEALAVFDPSKHEVVMTDNSMPGMSGAALGQFIKQRSPSTLLVMYSGTSPDNPDCFDLIVRRPAHLLALKDRLDELVRRMTEPHDSGVQPGATLSSSAPVPPPKPNEDSAD